MSELHIRRAASSLPMVHWSLALLLMGAAWLSGLPSSALAADAEDAAKATDDPILVIAAASIDRLLDRAVTMLESNGHPATRDDVLALLKKNGVIGLDDSEKVLKWFDPTKPAGMMVFFGSNPAPAKAEHKPADPDAECGDEEDVPVPNDGTTNSSTIDLGDALGAILDELPENLAVERFVYFLPVKSFEEFLASSELTPVPGKAHRYRDAKGAELAVRRMGDYVLAATDPDLLDHCPDPRGMVRSLLGKNDLVVSFQMKGLPVGMRLIGAEAIKTAYAASLQRRDDEPQREYQLRRALGDFTRELLELVVSHIDEVNLGLRVEPDKKELVVEFDLAGVQDGKLAKFAAELVPKRSPFASLWNPDSDASLALSLAFPERHAKPIAAAVRSYVATAEGEEKEQYAKAAFLIEAACKLLDSRQLDFILTGEGDSKTGSSLMALTIPGGPRFPEQFQQLLELAQSTPDDETTALQIAADAINGWPAHQLSMQASVSAFLRSFVGVEEDDVEIQGAGHSWLVATPQAIWFGSNANQDDAGVPSFLRSAIEQHLSNSAKPAASATRGIAPFRLSLHTREWKVSESTSADPDDEEDPKARQALLKQIEDEKQDREILQTMFQEKPEGIHVELRPTAAGLRLAVRFEEAYLAWSGHEVGKAFTAVPTEKLYNVAEPTPDSDK